MRRLFLFEPLFFSLKTSFAATTAPHAPIFEKIKTKMKKVVISLVAVITLSSCALTSQTTIGSNKAFELGDGEHGSFKATVKNISRVAVEVCETPMGGTEKKLITLQPGQQKTVRFGANTKAIFKNNNEKQADVKLKVTGDTRLTMGGPNY